MLWAYSITHREQLSIFLASLVLPGNTSSFCHLQTASAKTGGVHVEVLGMRLVLNSCTAIPVLYGTIWICSTIY